MILPGYQLTPLLTDSGYTVAGVEHLDLDALLEVSNALSGEESLDALITKLLTTVLEQAGGQRALLLNPELTTIRGSARLGDDGMMTDGVLRPLDADTAALSLLRSIQSIVRAGSAIRSVLIRTETDGASVRVAVSDSGPVGAHP